MKEAETTAHMIWEIESKYSQNVTFAYHSTSYLFCAPWLCADSPANQDPHTPEYTVYVFFQKILILYVGSLRRPKHNRRIVFDRVNGLTVQ